jgi:two-component system, LytTR family, response regulator
MKVFIIDNDPKFISEIEKALLEYNPDIKVLGKLNSAKKSLQWFQAHENPDLVFMDLEMAEEVEFETFEKLMIMAPIIYTTDFKDYIIRVFHSNEVDYILKPLDKDDLFTLLKKYESIVASSLNNMNTDVLDNVMKMLNNEYKKRFVIKEKGEVIDLSVNEICCVFKKDNKFYGQTLKKKEYIIQYSVDLLEKLLDPKLFFRVNDNYLVNITAIVDVVLNDDGAYEVTMRQNISNKLLVDKEKTSAFMKWYKE